VLQKIQRKWWFAIPVIVLTVGSTFWLSRALGLGDYPLKPLSGPRVVFFCVSFYSFLQLYSHLIRFMMEWLLPGAIRDRRTNS
jgi:hypothetical protein